MKVFILVTTLFILNAHSFSQEPNPLYNARLADSLGADERGMRPYLLVILKTGPYREDDPVRRDSLFRGHFSNMSMMANAGMLVMAGPLGTNEQNYRGIFILGTTDREEASRLLMNDPTIRSGIFEAELYDLYGSAALPMYLKTHTRIEKFNPQ